jgi:PadR family transcriptional regulator PadR
LQAIRMRSVGGRPESPVNRLLQWVARPDRAKSRLTPTLASNTTLASQGSFAGNLIMDFNEKFAPITKGLLEFLVLKIIAADKVYVPDILQQLSATEFATQEGTLYPLLSKMRREELVDYEWKESESGPPRKYYELTAKGRAQLRETMEFWQQINETVKNLGKK